jgi:AraC family transcriptional regulator
MENLEIKSEISYRQYYLSSINKVIDYIENKIDTPLDLQLLADVANFSPFHFHRIFLAIKGETLNSFIRRKRLEKSASFLISTDKPITEIAVLCGFNSNASFSRSFKEYFNSSATNFRKGGYIKYAKRLGISSEDTADYFEKVEEVVDKMIKDKRRIYQKVEVKVIKDFTVAYCRHVGRFDEIGLAFEKLMRWAGPRGLMEGENFKVLTLYHDDPKVTGVEKLQQSACISIDPNVKVEGEIGKMKIEGGKYAFARFEISEHEFTEAWTSLCACWLPESGYECDERRPFELFHNDYTKHPENKFILDICIPVKPLKLGK